MSEKKEFEYGLQDENEMTVTLTLDDDSELECVVIAIFTVQGKDYIALLSLCEENPSEVFLYRFLNNEEDLQLENIEDDEEFELVADIYDDLCMESDIEEYLNANVLKNQSPLNTSPLDEAVDYMDMATHYEDTNQLELAVECYKKASTAGYGFASICLADLYLKQGKVDLAEEWYRKESGDNDSCYGDGNNALAHFLVGQGREEEAWEYLLYVLFKNHADTAPYEGAMVLAWELLAEGKWWDKMTEECFYVVYLFLSSYFDGDGIHFVEEKLQECIDNDAPNAQDAAYILAHLYFKGEYRIKNYEGFYTDHVIEAPSLADKEKGMAVLEKLDDEDQVWFTSDC